MKIKIQNFYLYNKDDMGFHGVTKESDTTEQLNNRNGTVTITKKKIFIKKKNRKNKPKS